MTTLTHFLRQNALARVRVHLDQIRRDLAECDSALFVALFEGNDPAIEACRREWNDLRTELREWQERYADALMWQELAVQGAAAVAEAERVIDRVGE